MARVREIDWDSADCAKFLDLRQRYLRAPLGLDLHDEDLDTERDCRHFALLDDEGALIGGAVVVPHDDTSAQIRQMLVRPDQRRRGHGAEIVAAIEATLRDNGIEHIFLNARADAIEFYERCGYRVTGAEFLHVTIPHRRMEKSLAATS